MQIAKFLVLSLLWFQPGFKSKDNSITYETIPKFSAGDIVIERLEPSELPAPVSVGANSTRPLVIWHGLGDNYNSSGIYKAIHIFREQHLELTVFSVYLDKDPSEDERKSYFGDANSYVQDVCFRLSSFEELKYGFDAIGFSQGGLFMRALVERCSNLSVHNLITFGSPHMGIMEISICNDTDWFCRRRNEYLKKQIWHENIQRSIIPAQYFRDPYNYDQYLLHSHFLLDINNEGIDGGNITYIHQMEALNALVMVDFLDDSIVIPKESAHFREVDTLTGKVKPFEDSIIYKNDLVGLQALHERGAIKFLSIDEDHMRIPEEFFMNISEYYLGGQVDL